MSQAGIISVAAAPAVPTTFMADTGAATPVANILNVLGTNGVTTTAAGNTVTTSLRYRFEGTTTTVGAVTSTAVTLPLGATPGTYTLDVAIAGFDAVNNLSIGYTLVGAVRTTGAAAVLIAGQALDEFEEVALAAADAVIFSGANDALINVLGVAGHTINWKVAGTYTFVS